MAKHSDQKQRPIPIPHPPPDSALYCTCIACGWVWPVLFCPFPASGLSRLAAGKVCIRCGCTKRDNIVMAIKADLRRYEEQLILERQVLEKALEPTPEEMASEFMAPAKAIPPDHPLAAALVDDVREFPRGEHAP